MEHLEEFSNSLQRAYNLKLSGCETRMGATISRDHMLRVGKAVQVIFFVQRDAYRKCSSPHKFYRKCPKP